MLRRSCQPGHPKNGPAISSGTGSAAPSSDYACAGWRTDRRDRDCCNSRDGKLSHLSRVGRSAQRVPLCAHFLPNGFTGSYFQYSAMYFWAVRLASASGPSLTARIMCFGWPSESSNPERCAQPEIFRSSRNNRSGNIGMPTAPMS